MRTLEVLGQFNAEPKKRIVIALGGLLVASTATWVGWTAWRHGHTPTASQQLDSVNMLTLDWQYVPGVAQHDGTLEVEPTGFAIVTQDGSGEQSNPPVNEYGAHLAVAGDFEVAVSITRNLGGASLQVYDAPPVVADEFRIEPASVRLTEMGDQLEVQVMDGSPQANVQAPMPVYQHTFTLPDSPNNGELDLKRQGNAIDISAGGKPVASLPWGGVFHSGELWFGLDSSAGGFAVSAFRANGLHDSKIGVVDTTQQAIDGQPNGLQSLAAARRPGFTVGAAAALTPLVSDEAYASQLVSNFGSITLENAMKAQFISPRQGVYAFQEADALIALARKNHLSVHGHTLAFSEAEPAWMRNLPTGTTAERASTTSILLDYVRHVTEHFKGQLDSLDVINEPFDTDQGTDLQQNIWYKAMGPGYMAQVSKLVHSIDPNVKQYVNENGTELAGDRQDALLRLVRNINAQGGFIYGVGLQSHVYDMSSDAIDAGGLNATINRFGAAGFKVRISENDVTDDSGATAQANQYASIFRICLQNPACVSYTTWGVNDRYDWFIDDDGSLQQGYDLLFDGAKPTSAYDALRRLFH